MTDITAIRDQFPILDQQINGHPLVYLDSGATAANTIWIDFFRTNAVAHNKVLGCILLNGIYDRFNYSKREVHSLFQTATPMICSLI